MKRIAAIRIRMSLISDHMDRRSAVRWEVVRGGLVVVSGRESGRTVVFLERPKGRSTERSKRAGESALERRKSGRQSGASRVSSSAFGVPLSVPYGSTTLPTKNSPNSAYF